MTTLAPAATRFAAPDADVSAPLTFITPQDAKPVFHSQAYTGGEPQFFFEVETHDVPIANLRGHDAAFSLDREGFAVRRAPTAVSDFYDDAVIDADYKAEIAQILRDAMGAEQVAVFDVTRRSDGGAGASNRDGARGIASRIHVDYTAKSGPQRARDTLGAGVVDGLIGEGRRIAQVNVWRPIRGPVRRSPLALADASSVSASDLVATDQVFPDRVGEIYHLAYAPTQRWWYAPEMTTDEVLLIKGWDSLEDGRARFTPHTAFALPHQDDAPPRESIEVRAFVVI